MTINGIRLFSLGMLMVLATSLAGGQATTTSEQTGEVPEAASAHAQPALPANLPPQPPKVTCNGNQLTISAVNSSLESILEAVRGCSGAHIEIPAGAAKIRSFEELGPGPVRQVLDSLLSGTEFNYVIESSDSNPLKVESVVLSARKKDSATGSATTDVALTPSRRAWLQSRQNGRPDSALLDDPLDSTADQPANAAAPADAPDTSATQASAVSQNPTPSPAADAIANADPVKTDDKITSMQQMFEQRRQMTEKQNAPATPGATAPTPN
jgi:hypothetical protein